MHTRHLGAWIIRAILVLAGLFVFSFHVSARQVLVVSNAMSATYGPARMTLQLLDPDSGIIIRSQIVQPEPCTLVSMLYLKDLHAVALIFRENLLTDTQWQQSYIAFYDVVSLRMLYQERFPMTWRSLIAATDGEGKTLTAIRSDSRAIEHEIEHFGQAPGMPLRVERQMLVPAPLKIITEPLGLQALDDRHLALMCRGDQENQYVLRGLQEGDALNMPIPVNATHVYPMGICASPDGRFCYLRLSGYVADQPSGERATWVYALDRQNQLLPVGEPLQIPGETGKATDSLAFAGSDRFWLASYAQETQCAYATRIQMTSRGLIKEAHYPLPKASGPLRIASGTGDRLAVANGQKLEIWTGLKQVALSCAFKTSPTHVRWLTPDTLVVGEAGRIHVVEAQTGALLKTTPLQTGWVSDMLALPSPDTKFSKIGVPASPLSQSNLFPASITFRGESVGQEVKGIVLRDPQGNSGNWRIEAATSSLSWLVIHPQSGALPGVGYLGVDPQRYTPGIYREGVLKITLEGPGHPSHSTSLVVRVLPETRPEVRRILWLLEEGSASPLLEGLIRKLTAAPSLFAHQFQREPVNYPLHPYRIVVADVASVERGLLTRKQVLDYMADGGAFLFLGGASLAADSVVQRWLEPIGITLAPNHAAMAVTQISHDHVLCRHWNLQWTAKETLVESSRPETMLIGLDQPEKPELQQGILLASSYGLGRLVVLADRGPLGDTRFAGDLFYWLANPIGEGIQQDLDSDRLVDALEDRNGNNAVDPGETDYLNPDTDGDGLPDGWEDANLNGRVDEGETSPLLADTDGDGISDGAQDPR